MLSRSAKQTNMTKSIFDRIMDWPYHPQTIITIAFASIFITSMQDGGPVWAALIVAAIAAPFAALVLFLPYLLSVVGLAILLSLPKAIQAVLSFCNNCTLTER
jgi:hypothetical protein